MKKIGPKLVALRKHLKMTQKDLAAKLPGGTDYTYIGKIERNEQVPSLKILQKIASVSKVELEYFFTAKPPDYYIDKIKSEGLDSRIARTWELLNPEDKVFVAEVMDVFTKYNKFSKPVVYSVKQKSKALEAAEKGISYKTIKKRPVPPVYPRIKKGE